jgi:short-subunit dehydrogenase
MSTRIESAKQSMRDRFPERYGSWALIAGASAGLGAAYARALARRGMNLVLVARRKDLLEKLAQDLRGQFGVEVRCHSGDLATAGLSEGLRGSIPDLEVGLVVYNAAQAPVGDFAEAKSSDLFRVIDVNVRGPVALLRTFLPPMIERRRGAVVIMSSLAGNQGSPRIAAYAASKAFLRVLGEGLWRELKGKGIDVIVCCAGAVRTPGYAETSGTDAPGTLEPEFVAERTLRAIQKGPVVLPGFINVAANWFMSRLLSRRAAIGIMAGSTNNLADQKETTRQS